MKGLRARGGFEVSLTWTAGALGQVEITSHHGGICSILAERPVKVMSGEHQQRLELSPDGLISLQTQPGDRIVVQYGEQIMQSK